MRDSNDAAMALITAASGRRAPAGGIMPDRSLRIIFSVSSPLSSSLAASKAANEMPPALPRSLWQPAQYCFTTAVCSDGNIVVTAGGCEATVCGGTAFAVAVVAGGLSAVARGD